MSETEQEIKLTGKQKLFADYYVGEASLNATRAARLAGYKGDENTLAVIGSQNIRNHKIREYIDEQLKDLVISRNEMLTILTRHAKGSLADVLSDDGKFNLKDAKRRGVDGLLKELEIKETVKQSLGDTTILERNYKYKIHDAQSAVDKIAKIQGMIVDKSEIEHKGAIVTNLILPKVENDNKG